MNSFRSYVGDGKKSFKGKKEKGSEPFPKKSTNQNSGMATWQPSLFYVSLRNWSSVKPHR